MRNGLYSTYQNTVCRIFGCSNFCFLTSGCTCGSKRKKILDVVRSWRNGYILFCCHSGILLCREGMYHCVKSVQIRNFFGPQGYNQKRKLFRTNSSVLAHSSAKNFTFWSAFSHIWTEYGKIRTTKNSAFRHFSCSVCFLSYLKPTRCTYRKTPSSNSH